MLSNKTKGEKRKMFLLLWIVLGFLYYHVRFTGGFVVDVMNNFVVSEVDDPIIFEEESIKAYMPHKAALEEELEALVADTEGDREEAMKAIQLGGTKVKFDEVTEKSEEVKLQVGLKQQEYVSATANLIDKTDKSTEEAQLLSTISQLAARTGIQLVETTPVTNFSGASIRSKKNNSITTIPEGKQAIAGSPVVTEEQAAELLSSELLTCRQYKFTGSPLLFYVFLKQLQVLEQDVFILDTGINKSKINTENSPQVVFTVMLVY
ncbi:MAG: hypothetical protein VX776_00540 [Planctomycetota bacterium]|nr:hypothetical protein [Planctomycetota bacterium]